MINFAKSSLAGLLLLAVVFQPSARGNTFSVTNTASAGPGSFQQAITNANANPGPDTIVFNISGTPPFTITPTVALPQISDQVTIDATTQPGYAGKPVIELNGASTGGTTIGLRFGLGSDGSSLRGMAINRFPAQGIDISSASSIAIQGNFIGTDVNGTLARGNGGVSSPGIYVKSSGNLIGGTNTGDGNLISGGNVVGIYFQNASNNVVQGNFVGVNAAGTAALGNQNNGILINPGSGNLIGGPFSAARNLIAGNNASGVYLSGASTGNVIQGNLIGTDISGSYAISNATDGITLNGTPGNMIYSNLVSANGQEGVFISGSGAIGNRVLGNFVGTDVTGTIALGNHFAGVHVSSGGGNQIGGTNAGDGNVISGNVLDGVTLNNITFTNSVLGNVIGLNAAGTSPLHNSQNGISINGGSTNLIGGVIAGARNIISGNSAYGISILELTDKGNNVQGNYIGTDVTGTRALGNMQAGVLIQGCANTIGGIAPGAGNLISGNGQQGIYLAGNNGNITNNFVQGNFIGVNVNGTGSLGNTNAGVGIAGAANNVIGGTTAAARNVISANGSFTSGLGGVFIVYVGATGNQVLGNYIGTDVSGTLALGNYTDGIDVEQLASTNFIGGTAAGAGNLISANNVDGIYLTNSSWNKIQGNFIGTKNDGTNALGNTYHNVELHINATNNMIGGATPGAGNRIAFAKTSLRSGVRVRDGSLNNLISGNSIFSNAELGIDLGTFGVTAIADCESGMTSANANFGQNYPTLADAYSGAITRVRGTLDSKIGKTYTLQFFASPAGNALGYGEGQLFLGQTNLTLGASCSSNFTAYVSATVPTGWVVTATATDPNNNTSEFSAWVPVISVPPVLVALLNLGQLSVSWTNNGGSFGLQQTYSLTPPITWSTVTNVPVLQNNFMVTTLGTTNNSAFYRLIAL
jgi:titin